MRALALAARRPAGRTVEDPLAIPRNLAVRSVAQPGWARLAALGEHLCLHDTGDRLVLHEVDDDGEVTAFLAFDSSDRRGAFDEVARRAFDRCGVPAPTSRMVIAMNARDVKAVRDCMTDGCVVEDHRNLRVVPVETADEYAAAFRLFIELSQDYCVEMLRLDAAEPWGWVTLNRFAGIASDGGAFEMPTLGLSTWDETGRATLIAMYEPADREAALARLAEAAPG